MISQTSDLVLASDRTGYPIQCQFHVIIISLTYLIPVPHDYNQIKIILHLSYFIRWDQLTRFDWIVFWIKKPTTELGLKDKEQIIVTFSIMIDTIK